MLAIIKDFRKDYRIVMPERVSNKCTLAWLVDKSYLDSINLSALVAALAYAEEAAEKADPELANRVLKDDLETLKGDIIKEVCVDTEVVNKLQQNIALIRVNMFDNVLSVAFGSNMPTYIVDDFNLSFPGALWFLEFIKPRYKRWCNVC